MKKESLNNVRESPKSGKISSTILGKSKASQTKKRLCLTTEALIYSEISCNLFSCSLFSCRCLSCRNLLSLSCLATTTSLLSSSLRSLSHVLIKVNELDESNLSCVTLTGTQLDNASVTTWTVSYLLSYLTEESLNSILILKITENYTT